jgi:predicted DNA-binding transcriptional regulator AlpA
MDHVDFNRLPNEALVRLFVLFSLCLLPFSTSTLWRRVRAGTFPAPVRVSPQVVAWRVGDIREFLRDPANYRVNKQGTQSRADTGGRIQ